MPSRVRRKTKQDLYLSERYIFVGLVTDADTKRMPTVCETNDRKSSKRIEITPEYDTVLAENQDRLLSDTGINYELTVPFKLEGAFGVLKQDLGFRRCLHRGSGNVP